MVSRRVLALLGGLAVALAGAACSSTAKHPPASTHLAPPVTTNPVPERTSGYAGRTLATLTVDGADGMVAAAGALWVKTDPGHVIRIDPTTNKITDDIVVDRRIDRSAYCQGIGAAGDEAWSCATRKSGTGVAQIDASTRRLAHVIPGQKIFDQLAIPSTARGLWLLTGDGSTLTLVDPRSRRTASYPLGGRYLQLAAHGSRVLATSAVDGTVAVVDASTGGILKRTKLDAPRVAALTDDSVWVDTEAGLARLTNDLEVRTVYRGMSAGLGGDVYADGRSVWLRDSGGVIFRIDAKSGQVRERISPAGPISAGSLIIAFGSIWTSLSEEGKVVRLRLDA